MKKFISLKKSDLPAGWIGGEGGHPISKPSPFSPTGQAMTQFLSILFYPNQEWNSAKLEILYSTDYYSDETCIPEIPTISTDGKLKFDSGRDMSEVQDVFRAYIREETGYLIDETERISEKELFFHDHEDKKTIGQIFPDLNIMPSNERPLMYQGQSIIPCFHYFGDKGVYKKMKNAPGQVEPDYESDEEDAVKISDSNTYQLFTGGEFLVFATDEPEGEKSCYIHMLPD